MSALIRSITICKINRTAPILCLALAFATLPAQAQQPAAILLQEVFKVDYQYYVDCRVRIDGVLILPPEPGQLQGDRVAVTGSSIIKYDERILGMNGGKIDRTVRHYDEMSFERRAGKNDQQGKLRNEARRLVILRKNHLEVPFCPHGPLLWDELDMVRTDIFTPALQGLLPANPVRLKDSWRADSTAMQELTDLETINAGALTCEFRDMIKNAGRSYAVIAFEGKVTGVNEDGPAQHEINGHLYFDLASNHLSYLTMTGKQLLLDKNGKATGGRIEGTCVVTREASPRSTGVSDAALKGLDLLPNEQNTLLWFVNPEAGVSFLYPRNWHIAGVNGPKRQIGVDAKGGSGILISADAAANIPAAAKFQKDVAGELARQKLQVIKIEPARTLNAGLEAFGIEAQQDGKRVYLQYFLVRQKAGGAVLTANVQAADLAGTALRADVDRIARSLVVMAPAKR
jgi:hypothetical protein